MLEKFSLQFFVILPSKKREMTRGVVEICVSKALQSTRLQGWPIERDRLERIQGTRKSGVLFKSIETRLSEFSQHILYWW